MKGTRFGQEIQRLRAIAGLSLRALAAKLDVSASHLSDIEHDRRRPSEDLLRGLASALRGAGTTFAALEERLTGIDAKTLEWAAVTPGARILFRRVRESGHDPREILRALDKMLVRPTGRKRRTVS